MKTIFNLIPLIIFFAGISLGEVDAKWHEQKSDEYISIGAVQPSGQMEVDIFPTLEECENQNLPKGVVHPVGGANGNYCFAHVMEKANMKNGMEKWGFEIKFVDCYDDYWFYE